MGDVFVDEVERAKANYERALEAEKKVEARDKCLDAITKEIRQIIPAAREHTYDKAQANAYQTALNIIRAHRSKL